MDPFIRLTSVSLLLPSGLIAALACTSGQAPPGRLLTEAGGSTLCGSTLCADSSSPGADSSSADSAVPDDYFGISSEDNW